MANMYKALGGSPASPAPQPPAPPPAGSPAPGGGSIFQALQQGMPSQDPNAPLQLGPEVASGADPRDAFSASLRNSLGSSPKSSPGVPISPPTLSELSRRAR